MRPAACSAPVAAKCGAVNLSTRLKFSLYEMMCYNSADLLSLTVIYEIQTSIRMFLQSLNVTYSRHLPKIHLKVNNSTQLYFIFSVLQQQIFIIITLNLYNKFEMNVN